MNGDELKVGDYVVWVRDGWKMFGHATAVEPDAGFVEADWYLTPGSATPYLRAQPVAIEKVRRANRHEAQFRRRPPEATP